jgi:peptidyl-prolyl cis-trans isomerase A (cyclophilin A)
MIRRSVLAAALLGLALPSLAQEVPAPPSPPAAPEPATMKVVMTTELGPITIALETERAPVTAGYILKHVDEKRLDGAAFYRAYKITPDGSIGLVQAGIQDGRKLLPPVAHEPMTKALSAWLALRPVRHRRNSSSFSAA